VLYKHSHTHYLCLSDSPLPFSCHEDHFLFQNKSCIFLKTKVPSQLQSDSTVCVLYRERVSVCVCLCFTEREEVCVCVCLCRWRGLCVYVWHFVCVCVHG